MRRLAVVALASSACLSSGGSNTVTMSIAGASSTTAPWDFALEIEPGLRDVMAVGNGKVAIGRGLAIDKPTQLTLIDVVANGTPLVPVPLALANLRGGETITTEIDLYSAN